MEYLWLTIRHKWFVFLAGLRTKAPLWRLIIHDWSKFTPSELPHYQRQFFEEADAPEKFIGAWIHHQNHNPHHWEYWIPRTGHTRCDPPYPANVPIEMPKWAVREMVADWLAAGRVYDGQWPDVRDWPWYDDHFPSMKLHKRTSAYVIDLITYLHAVEDIKDGHGK